ncbi:GntR family transcriptional regulator [Bacillaceae bacterium JMAK1]|nr:GntR family transcriptional regulator [Bacillaceae bacterium JMAK1]
MKSVLDESKPIFQQIFDMIADDIVDGEMLEGEQIPSTTEISKFYQVNRATVQKGLSMLVEAGYAYKQRGVGMFVAEGAKKRLLTKRKEEFYIQYVKPTLSEAKRLQMSKEEFIQLIEEDYDDKNR